MRRLVLIAAAFVAAAGCGGGDDGGDANAVLAETAANLRDVRSGVLDVRLVVEPKGATGERVGFELHGPFALGGEGEPPRFQMEYAQILGERTGEVTVTAAGGKAYVGIGDETYELPGEQARTLLEAGSAVAGDSGLEQLDITDWLESPELSDGDEVGGEGTDQIEARLDVAAVARDLVELAQSFGVEGVSAFSDAEAERLRRAADDAHIEVLTGEDDRLLRRVSIQLDLGLDVPRGLRDAFGSIVGGELDFELTIENPNEPVEVTPPADARPPSELPGG